MSSSARKSFGDNFGVYALLFLIIFVMPPAVNFWGKTLRDKQFYSRSEQISERCVERAGQKGLPTEVCFDIQASTEAAYSSANGFQSDQFFLPIFFAFACALVAQRQRIIKLEERLDA